MFEEDEQVFETGLPTRYCFDRSVVAFERLVPSDTVTACPCKGVTSACRSAPNERVDGERLERPETPFSR